MRTEYEEMKVQRGLRRMIAIGIAGMLAGAVTMAPIASAATNSRDEERVTNQRVIDRAEMENLQRWVSAGHADWCKDARLVAAEELKWVAAEYSGEGFELNSIASVEDSNAGNRIPFEWATLDGQVLYRVTVERFEWLLPIAKSVDSIVWVPTRAEIRSQE